MSEEKTVGREAVGAWFDAGTFTELGAGTTRKDGTEEGVICGYGTVEGKLVFAFVQDGDRRKGAFDEIHAKKIERLYELAVRAGAPVIGIFNSAGALVGEGAAVLSGYGRVMKCVSGASGVIPQFAVIDGVCGGCAAAIAAMFDVAVTVRESGKLFVNPPFLVGAENTEYCAKIAENEEEARAFVRSLLSLLPSHNAEGAVIDLSGDDPERAVALAGKTAKESAVLCADDGKFFSLYDAAEDPTTVGFAAFGGVGCGVVATGGLLTVTGARRAAKLVSFCDAFHLPVVTVVDCEGLDRSADAEKAPFASELARLAMAYASADTALVTLILGRAYGAPFTLLGSRSLGADIVFAAEGACVSALSPEASVAFLQNDKITDGVSREQLETAWKADAASARDAMAKGEIDMILPDAEMRARLCAAVGMLVAKAEGVPARKHGVLPF